MNIKQTLLDALNEYDAKFPVDVNRRNKITAEDREIVKFAKQQLRELGYKAIEPEQTKQYRNYMAPFLVVVEEDAETRFPQVDKKRIIRNVQKAIKIINMAGK